MRRPTLYKHRGKWYARIWDEDAGKYFSRALGIPVEGKKERRKKAEEAAIRLADKIVGERAAVKKSAGTPASIPLIEYVANFWQADGEYAREKALVEKKPLSAHYLLSNRRLVETKIKPFPGFEGLTLASLTKPIIRQWKIWLAEQGYSGRVINSALLALRVPVKRMFDDDIIPADPFAGVARAAHKEKKRGILKPDEIKRLINTPVTNPHSRLAIYLSLYCSMRMGEVRGLQWGDISDGVIHIRHNWQEKEGLKECKCGSEGYVPMIGIVAELVNEIYKTAPLTGQNDFVMSQKPYRPACREVLTKSLQTELLSIGITEQERKERNIVYHSLRHSFVTACRVAGLSAFETMTLSRHKDAKMLDRYTHGQEAIDVKALGEKLENYFLPS